MTLKKENETVVKSVGGRPLKFLKPEDLVAAIDAYFDATESKEWSVTGLAIVVGSKQTIQDYEKREGFKEIIHRAKLYIENSYELALRETGGANNIFALKNFGWKDTQQLQGDKENPIQSKLIVEAGPGIQGTIAALGVAQLAGPSNSDTDGDTS